MNFILDHIYHCFYGFQLEDNINNISDNNTLNQRILNPNDDIKIEIDNLGNIEKVSIKYIDGDYVRVPFDIENNISSVQYIIDHWCHIEENKYIVIKDNLYETLLQLKNFRKNKYNREFLHSHIKSIFFHCRSNQMIPYKFSIKKDKNN